MLNEILPLLSALVTHHSVRSAYPPSLTGSDFPFVNCRSHLHLGVLQEALGLSPFFEVEMNQVMPGRWRAPVGHSAEEVCPSSTVKLSQAPGSSLACCWPAGWPERIISPLDLSSWSLTPGLPSMKTCGTLYKSRCSGTPPVLIVIVNKRNCFKKVNSRWEGNNSSLPEADTVNQQWATLWPSDKISADALTL